MNARRKVGFLIAQKSWDTPVIGWMARALGCVPLSRAADLVQPGEGTIRVHGDVALGSGTRIALMAVNLVHEIGLARDPCICGDGGRMRCALKRSEGADDGVACEEGAPRMP